MNFVCFIVVIIATQCNGYNDLYDISQFLEQWDANRLLSTYDCSYCRRMDKLESSETEHNLSRTKRDVESNEPLLSSVRLEDEDANFDLFQEDEQTSQKAKNDFFDRMIGLSHLPDSSSEQNINFLLRRALEKVAFFPFSISLEFWRWDVFSGKITNQHLNAGWWENKLKYQGIYPPVERTEHDFDPASKYHVTSGTPYIRYFIAHILEFQLYETLCKLSGHKGPLHLCDFQGSKVAGRHFRKMLEMGNSKHWEDILRKLSGSCHMDAGSTLRFFKPLTQWLVKENKRLGNKIGWD
uniref:Angiotensin-converting enzyme n=1 Tax=Ciona savignyi TaxID=51511 RepID=H2Z6E0_CIOSA